METNLYWVKNEGMKILHKLMGLIQWSDMGRSDDHKTPILKELLEFECRLKMI